MHGSPHCFIHGHMCTFYSPEDPFFFMHHCNIDRMWAIWQDYYDFDLVPISPTDALHYDNLFAFLPNDINTPLDFPGSAHSHYYLNPQTGVNPTVNELHHISTATNPTGVLDVTYINDLMGKSLVLTGTYAATNNPAWVEIGVDDIRFTCPSAIDDFTSRKLQDSPCPVEGDFEILEAPLFFNDFSLQRWTALQSLNLRNCRPASDREQESSASFADPSTNLVCDTIRPPRENLNQIRNEFCDLKGNPEITVPEQWIEINGLEDRREIFACKRDSNGTIFGTVVKDVDEDGVGDVPLSDAIVNLVTVEESSQPLSTTTIDSDGFYSFRDVPTGVYIVEATSREGESQFQQVDVSDGKLIEVDVAFEGTSLSTPPTPGPSGLVLGSLSGSVLEDMDNDDVGDAPLDGVEIELSDAAGNVIATTLTDSKGSYTVYDLPAGTYSMVEINPPNYGDVTDADGALSGGSNDDLDSTISPVILAVGENKTGLDFVDEVFEIIVGAVLQDEDEDGSDVPVELIAVLDGNN